MQPACHTCRPLWTHSMLLQVSVCRMHRVCSHYKTTESEWHGCQPALQHGRIACCCRCCTHSMLLQVSVCRMHRVCSHYKTTESEWHGCQPALQHCTHTATNKCCCQVHIGADTCVIENQHNSVGCHHGHGGTDCSPTFILRSHSGNYCSASCQVPHTTHQRL